MIVNGCKIGPGVNLSGANLEGAYLREADLRGANFTDANLTCADLNGANLSGATLECVDLSYANLTSADLSHANLRHAYLRDASLNYANLEGANLGGAKLTNARLNDARLKGADLRNANLYGAKITPEQIKSADGSRVGKIGKTRKNIIPDLLEEIGFRLDVEVIATSENQDRIEARLDQLSSDAANLAGISKEETPAKTILEAIEASNLTPEIMELVSDAVFDCAEME